MSRYRMVYIERDIFLLRIYSYCIYPYCIDRNARKVGKAAHNIASVMNVLLEPRMKSLLDIRFTQ